MSEVRNDDLWLMVLCTVRYSMGRQTYMSDEAPALAMRYAKALTLQQLEHLRREVIEELAMRERVGKKLGADCDHRSWQRFVERLTVAINAARKLVHATDTGGRDDAA